MSEVDKVCEIEKELTCFHLSASCLAYVHRPVTQTIIKSIITLHPIDDFNPSVDDMPS